MASRAWVPVATRPSSHRTVHLVVDVDADGPGTLVEPDAATEEVVLERGGHLGILLRQHLLAAHDEGHLAAERREHVDELHTGDAGPDHDQVLGQLAAAGRRRGW